jgi:hypothetical protein
MNEPTPQQILDIPMEDNDSGADSIRGYLVALLTAVWEEGEGFSGKRPFGNSSWEYDLYIALANAGQVTLTLDEDGYVEEFPSDQRDIANQLIADAIQALGSEQP